MISPRRGHTRSHLRRSVVALFLVSFLLGACGRAAIPTVQPTGAARGGAPTAQPTQAAQSATAPPRPAAPRGMPTATTAVQPTPTSRPAANTGLTIPPVLPWARATPTPPPLSATTPDPLPTPQPRAGLPVRLLIPAIGVDAEVEFVGLAPDGAMDVPKNYDNVAWYSPGVRPGENGVAAIAGHVDSQTREAVFWELKKLRPGDEIIVLGDDGIERRFVVTTSESYKRNDAPIQRIFGSAIGPHLNLITCSGTFDRRIRQYDSNLVVYTEAAP